MRTEQGQLEPGTRPVPPPCVIASRVLVWIYTGLLGLLTLGVLAVGLFMWRIAVTPADTSANDSSGMMGFFMMFAFAGAAFLAVALAVVLLGAILWTKGRNAGRVILTVAACAEALLLLSRLSDDASSPGLLGLAGPALLLPGVICSWQRTASDWVRQVGEHRRTRSAAGR